MSNVLVSMVNQTASLVAAHCLSLLLTLDTTKDLKRTKSPPSSVYERKRSQLIGDVSCVSMRSNHILIVTRWEAMTWYPSALHSLLFITFI